MTTQRNQDAIYQPYEWRNLWDYNTNEHALLRSCPCATQTEWLSCGDLWRLISILHQKPITRSKQFPCAGATVRLLTEQFIFRSIFPRLLTIKLALQILQEKPETRRFFLIFDSIYVLLLFFIIIVLWLGTQTGQCFHFRGKKYCKMMLNIKWFVKTPFHYKPRVGVASSRLWTPALIHLNFVVTLFIRLPGEQRPFHLLR